MKNVFAEVDGNFREKVLEILRATHRPVAVFDLDGTVFDVTHRSVEILRRFLDQPSVAEQFPRLTALAKTIQYKDFKYSMEQTLNAFGIDRYSQQNADFLHAAEDYWFKNFFTSELLAFDRPYAGALECVQFFHKNGAHIVYLSGRDIPNMSAGTIRSLEDYGFPHEGHTVSIFLKPAYGQDDLLFKKGALDTISQLGDVVASFDNEPANVQLFLDRYPKALNVHYHSLFSRPQTLSGESLRIVRTFAELGFVDLTN